MRLRAQPAARCIQERAIGVLLCVSNEGPLVQGQVWPAGQGRGHPPRGPPPVQHPAPGKGPRPQRPPRHQPQSSVLCTFFNTAKVSMLAQALPLPLNKSPTYVEALARVEVRTVCSTKHCTHCIVMMAYLQLAEQCRKLLPVHRVAGRETNAGLFTRGAEERDVSASS